MGIRESVGNLAGFLMSLAVDISGEAAVEVISPEEVNTIAVKLSSYGIIPADCEFVNITNVKLIGLWRYKHIYDYPDSEPKFEEVIRFSKIVDTIEALNGSRVGAMGYCDMGLYSLMLDGVAFKKQLGMDIEDIFSYEAGKSADEVPWEEVDKVVEEIRTDLRFDGEPTYEQLEKTARLTCALRNIARERKYLGVTMKCVYGVSRHMGFTPCLTQALLSKNITSICESDVPGLVTNVILKQLTGQSATFMENYECYQDKALVDLWFRSLRYDLL